jgi:sugar lactone lactonase YvrE
MQYARLASLRPLAASLVLVLAACGGGGIDGVPASGTSAEPTSFSIGGSASGLETGNAVTLQDNGGDDLAVSADGNFAFATAVTGPYAVTIGRQPLWQDCTVANGSGTATADVSGVSVNCAPYAAYVTTLAGNAGVAGTSDGTGSAASFFYPVGVAFDASGNAYVADSAYGLLRKITPAGVVTTLVASGLNTPWGVAVGPDGNIYVALYGANAIAKVTPDGTVTTFAGSGVSGSADGNGTAASFQIPTGVAFDRAGNLYVSELPGRIRKITPAGDVTTLVPASSGIGASYALAVDGDGVVYVPDFLNSQIWKVLPDGTLSVFAGTTPGSDDGPVATATFITPVSIAVGRDGAVYVGDYSPGTIRRISRAGVVSTIAGNASASGSTDGPATTVATLGGPTGLAFDAAGSLWFSDYNDFLVRKVGRP